MTAQMLISKEDLEELYWGQGLSTREIGERLDRDCTTILYWLRKYGIPTRQLCAHKGPIPKELLERLYLERGLSAEEIGARVGCSKPNVFYWLNKYDIPTRPSTQEGHNGPPPTRELLEALYWQDNLSCEEIAEETGYSFQHIWELMRGYGIPFRSRCDTSARYTRNDLFFHTWSPEMSWCLGLMFADGNVMPKRHSWQCRLNSKDRDLLEQVAFLMKTDTPITNGHGCYMLAIGGQIIGERLVSLGCKPNKSRTMRFPEVPRELLPHFCRGCWDGDGSISVRCPESGHGLYTQFCCGSRQFVARLRDTLEAQLALGGYYCERQTSSNPVYQIRYRHRDSIELLRWMYRDSTPLTRLSRKYEIARPFLA